MKIENNFKIKDKISGLFIEVQEGDFFNTLHIESLDGLMNRDFSFTQEGEFDGTSTAYDCASTPAKVIG